MGAERSSCEDCCRKRFRKWNFEVARRDTLTKEVVAKDSITSYVSDLLEQIQKELFEKHWITERILRK
jgi:hypothetical protein